MISFKFFGRDFPIEPKTYFYNWLYLNALNTHEDLKNELMNFDSFTDIEFNPQKSFNCQAESVAIFIGLNKAGLINEALKDEKSFLKTVYSDDFVNVGYKIAENKISNLQTTLSL